MKETHVQRNYKDTMFRMLFKEKENALDLYNALNKTAYTDTDKLEITTLENAIYLNYKNDISFVFEYELMLYEHQSTVNRNMPLRDLIYVTEVLQGRIEKEDLYDRTMIKLPTPRFVVFYNGMELQPEDYCIQNRILADFLSKNRTEAIAMCIYEYNEELHLKNEYKRGLEEGNLERIHLEEQLMQKDEQIAKQKHQFEQQISMLIDKCKSRGDDAGQTVQLIRDVFRLNQCEAEERMKRYW